MDKAISWWRDNTPEDDSNAYDYVTVFGNKYSHEPWRDPDGAMFIGNELRQCRYVGIHLGWVGGTPPYGCGPLHVITAWGDDRDDMSEPELRENPMWVYVTDSDAQAGDPPEDVQGHLYDDYDNPATPNRDKGWYLNDYLLYGAALHPFIMNITTLGDSESEHPNYVTASESVKIVHEEPGAATGLHYIACTDTVIIEYDTTVEILQPGYVADCTVDDSDPYRIEVNCAFTPPLPTGTPVRITTRFVELQYNDLCHWDIYFTTDKSQPRGVAAPGVQWQIDTPYLADTDPAAPGLCRGYVVGAFTVCADEDCQIVLAEHRVQHEYGSNEDPERHDIYLTARPENLESCYLCNLRFAHSDVELDDVALWGVSEWDWIDEGPPRELAPGASDLVLVEYPERLPTLNWSIVSGDAPDPEAWNATGGYVYGGFRLYSDPGGMDLLREHRFQYRYDYTLDPEHHEFELDLLEAGISYFVGELRFGHSYGKLSSDELCALDLAADDGWIGEAPDLQTINAAVPVLATLDWSGLLPYPEMACCPLGDCNCDGVVSFDDIAPFVLALTGEAVYAQAYPDCYWTNADCDLDGDVDFDDINAFVSVLMGGG